MAGQGKHNQESGIHAHSSLRRHALHSERDPLAAGLRESNVLRFAAHRESVNMTNEQLELVFVLLAVCCAMYVSISQLETLYVMTPPMVGYT